jgi:predicted Zn-dependent protease
VDELAPPLINAVQQGHSDSPLILETLTQAYVHRLRYREAHACASRWIEESPDSGRPYQWRGFVLERMNEAKAAMTDYEAALERDPGNFQVRLRVAEMWMEDNQVDKAVPRLEQLAKEDPNHPLVMARLGQCRYLQNQSGEARRLLEAAVKELPRDFEVLIHLAKLEMQEDRPARAEYWLRRGLEVDPADVPTHYALVRALQLQGRKEEAAAALAVYEKYSGWLEEANKLLAEEAKQPTTSPERPYQIGIRLLRLGQKRLGLHWLNEALARAPGHTPTLDALAEYRKESGAGGNK